MRPIDADALMETIKAHDYILATVTGAKDDGMFTLGIKEACDMQPTLDVAPVRHGRWKQESASIFWKDNPTFRCSECDWLYLQQHKYCPHCGAKMDENGEDA